MNIINELARIEEIVQNKQTFQTKEDAYLHLQKLAAQGLLGAHTHGYTKTGPYLLRPGEFGRPFYLPARTGDKWAILKTYFFYNSAKNKPAQCLVTLEVTEFGELIDCVL